MHFPVRQLSPRQFDLAVAAAVVLAGAVEALLTPLAGSRTLALATIAVQGGALAWRRRAPMPTVVAVTAAQLASGLMGLPANALLASLAAILLAMYAAGSQASMRSAVACLVVAGAIVSAAVLMVHRGPSDVAFGLVVVAVPWAAGRAMQGRGAHIARLELEQESVSRQAVAAERARIAREMHDVVAHSMGVMVIQAQAAERMIDVDSSRSRAAMREIESIGREALVEMHRLVGLLRDSPEAGSLAPEGSLRHLDALVEQVRGAGLAVTLRCSGDVEGLPPGVDLAAYRIVQEALTNSLKHGGRDASVCVRRDGGFVEISVDDAGPAPARTTAGGHGIVGMRERARLYGGTLEAGARPGGGFSVKARLPSR